jgi:hypothetical protein
MFVQCKIGWGAVHADQRLVIFAMKPANLDAEQAFASPPKATLKVSELPSGVESLECYQLF